MICDLYSEEAKCFWFHKRNTRVNTQTHYKHYQTSDQEKDAEILSLLQLDSMSCFQDMKDLNMAKEVELDALSIQKKVTWTEMLTPLPKC
jgi:hypothetical protein